MKDFTILLISNAKKWVGCKEDDNRPNRSVCVDKVHAVFNHARPWAWCAEFAYMVTDQTTKELGIKNKLPKTSSTHEMINKSPGNGLRVDSRASKGSIMFYSTGTSTGHVGIVTSVNKDSFDTIEGNTSDAVGMRNHKNNAKYRFIHIEEMGYSGVYQGLPTQKEAPYKGLYYDDQPPAESNNESSDKKTNYPSKDEILAKMPIIAGVGLALIGAGYWAFFKK